MPWIPEEKMTGYYEHRTIMPNIKQRQPGQRRIAAIFSTHDKKDHADAQGRPNQQPQIRNNPRPNRKRSIEKCAYNSQNAAK